MKLLLGTTEQDRERYEWLSQGLTKWFPEHRQGLEKLTRTRRGVQIVLDPIPLRQTDEQRGYYHLSLNFWATELGYSAREAHDQLHNAVCCEAFGVKKSIQIGARITEIPQLTSSVIDREGYSLLIETMLQMAGETGVNIPPPTTREQRYGKVRSERTSLHDRQLEHQN